MALEKTNLSQTYDGTAVMAGELNGLQSRVRQKYSDVLFFHCCAHRVSLILSQAICNSKECKIPLRH
jgi:putative lipase involved disintegration of autophagic bodies